MEYFSTVREYSNIRKQKTYKDFIYVYDVKNFSTTLLSNFGLFPRPKKSDIEFSIIIYGNDSSEYISKNLSLERAIIL